MKPGKLFSPDTVALPCKFSYLHGRKKDFGTSFEKDEKISLSFLVPRILGAESLSLELFSESLSERILVSGAEWCGMEGECDLYVFSLPKGIAVGLYFMRPVIYSFGKPYFGHKWGREIYFNSVDDKAGLMQLSVCDFKYKKPSSLYGGIIYHIFVDRFNRGSKKVSKKNGSVHIDGEWENIPEFPAYPGAPLKNNTFYGGTLYGVIERLDHISSLGVDTIYLSPIFDSPSNHKYDTANYMSVDEEFGGDEALRSLIDACKRKNIKIILDGVFNHTGADSIYFNRFGTYDVLGAYQSKKSDYYDWFDFKSFPNKYTCWWNIEILPRINPDNSKCGDYFVAKGGVIDKYLSMGIYGFRLDVADELSDSFISNIKERQSSQDKENMLYGEVCEDASNKISYNKRKKYYLGCELDGVMNYPLRRGLIDYILRRNTAELSYYLNDVLLNAPKRVRDAQMNLLGTHDTERILTVFGGVSGDGKSNSEKRVMRMSGSVRALAKKRLKAAYTVLATLPGVPAIFYGDEAGLEGYSDPFNRMPYPYGREDEELLSHYKIIGNIRRSNDVYREGDIEVITLTENVFAFARSDNGERYVTVLNNSEVEIDISFSALATELIKKQKSKCHSLSSLEAGIYKIKENAKILIN